MVAPYIATIKVGDLEFGASGEYNMVPGEYEVTISADGFETKTGKISLKEDETSELKLYLLPNTETTMNWYNEHAEDALIVGEIQNNETLKAVDKLLEKEPVLQKLPLLVEFYSNDYSEYTKYIISYEYDDSNRGFFILMKDYTGAGIEAAKTKLVELGMNIDGVEFKYENLVSDSSFGHTD